MADLKSKMFKVAAGATRSAPAVHAPETAYRHRISLDVPDGLYEALKVRAFHDRVPMVELIRTVLNGWCQSEGIDT